jgi:hypothetical protein
VITHEERVRQSLELVEQRHHDRLPSEPEKALAKEVRRLQAELETLKKGT